MRAFLIIFFMSIYNKFFFPFGVSYDSDFPVTHRDFCACLFDFDS